MSALTLEEFRRMVANTPPIPEPKYYVFRVDGQNNPGRELSKEIGGALFGEPIPMPRLEFGADSFPMGGTETAPAKGTK